MSFPRYERYKDSGVGWLGKVPEHWQIFALKRIANLQSGETIGPEAIEPVGEYPVYGGNGRRGFTSTFTHNGIHALIGRQGALCGNVNYASGEFWASEHAIVVTPIQGADTTWLGELLREMNLNQYSIASAQPGLSVDNIRKLLIAVPTLPEQQAIGHFLRHETAKIDTLIEEQRRLIDLLKEKRQAIISHAVTKGFNPDASRKDSGIEWIGEVPRSWQIRRLRMVADVRGGVAKGRDLGESATINVPYLRVANVQDGYLDLTEIATIEITLSELERYRLRSGDVLMNEGGDFDKLGRGHIWRGEIDDCIHQNHVFSVRPKDIEPEWLTLISTADCGRFYFMTRSKQSTNLASISSSNLGELPVPVPPAAERKEILARVHAVTKAINTLIDNATSATALLQERRTALISAAVTGKIDVRSYNPKEAA